MTFLAYFFTMKKAPVKIIFGHKKSIHGPIFQIFVALFRSFGMQDNDKIIFVYGHLEQDEMQKGCFQRMA